MNKSYKQSEPRELSRSQISLAGYNPRKLSPEARKRLKANIKRIGLAGGIVWNETTGNLVSGHQRLTILDEIQHYNPETHENDYPVRVEVLRLSPKEEKEQNIFFNSQSAQGEWDNDLLAQLIPDIDVDLAGLDPADLNILMADSPVYDVADYDWAVKRDFEKLEALTDADREARKEAIKEAKAETKGRMVEDYESGEAYVTLSFQNYANKLYFMETIARLIERDIRPDDKYLKGEELQPLIDR